MAYLQLRGAVTTLEFAPAGSEPLLAATSSAGVIHFYTPYNFFSENVAIPRLILWTLHP